MSRSVPGSAGRNDCRPPRERSDRGSVRRPRGGPPSGALGEDLGVLDDDRRERAIAIVDLLPALNLAMASDASYHYNPIHKRAAPTSGHFYPTLAEQLDG
jgi:hypothetical protein